MNHRGFSPDDSQPLSNSKGTMHRHCAAEISIYVKFHSIQVPTQIPQILIPRNNRNFCAPSGHLSAAEGRKYYVPLRGTWSRLPDHGHDAPFADGTRDDGFCLPQPRGSVLTSPFSQVAPPFASGVVFLSAMLDRLTVQCYYNRDLLSILQAIRWIFHNSFAETQPSHRYHPGMCGI